MSAIPLFPLNTVLFPNTPIYLHIFEERYKRMINLCIQEKRPFGVVLIRHGLEALGPLAEPYKVGCLAHIAQVESLEEGRKNIVAVGTERFRLLSTDTASLPYLTGEVEAFPWQIEDRRRLEQSNGDLRRRLFRYVELITSANPSGSGLDLTHLPSDPLALACVAASILPIEPAEKQALLEQPDAGGFIAQVLEIYRREQALAHALIAHRDEASGSHFSMN